jgi:hypothetical protein
MHAEWKYRYGHPSSKQHKSYIVAQYLRDNIPDASKFEKVKIDGVMTPFALAMPDEHKIHISNSPKSKNFNNAVVATGTSHGNDSFDAIASYRSYYLSEQKRRIAKWGKKRGMPGWYARGLRKQQEQYRKQVVKRIKFVIVK